MKGNSKLLWAKNLKRERDENASLSRSVGMLKVKLKTVQEEASQLILKRQRFFSISSDRFFSKNWIYSSLG